MVVVVERDELRDMLVVVQLNTFYAINPMNGVTGLKNFSSKP